MSTDEPKEYTTEGTPREARKPPRKVDGPFTTLVKMGGGYFPVTVSLIFSIFVLVIILVRPETAAVAFGFLSMSLMPILIGHQSWKTQQTVNAQAESINQISEKTTADVKQVVEQKTNEIAQKTDEVAQKVDESISVKPDAGVKIPVAILSEPIKKHPHKRGEPK